MSEPSTRIYLTGFMGSGKSAVGPHLARRLGYRFVDLDRLIEEEAGLTVAALFRVRGEGAFRQAERKAVEKVANEVRVVVSLGGGVVVDARLRALLLATGTLVCLSVPFDVLVERLSRHPARRPMLHGEDGQPLTGEALERRITDLMKVRAPAYAEAHVTVDGNSPSPDETARRVIAALRGRPDPP
jgi:shikimate kinase